MVQQPASASRCAAETERAGAVVATSPVGWESRADILAAHTTRSGVFCCAGRAPIALAELSSPVVLCTAAKPHLPAAFDFTFTFDPCVPPGKSPGAFIPKHSPLPRTMLSPLRHSKENVWRSTRMLSEPCLAPQSLLPQGLLLPPPAPARSLGVGSRCQVQRFHGLVTFSLKGSRIAR